MDLKVVLATFISVFIAELGDKTQLLTFGASAASQSRFSVFCGAALALVCASLVGVLAGALLGEVISPKVLERVGGTLFIVIGCYTLFRSFT